MQLNAYLSFNGTCEQAFRYYAKHLGGKIEAMIPFADAPAGEKCGPEVKPEWKKKIMHASLRVGEAVLMGGDPPPPYYAKPQGVSVNISLSDADEAERIFNALADGGEVQMPLGESFFASRFGMLVDRFGTPWMIHCEKAA